jgi:hypothetical protein
VQQTPADRLQQTRVSPMSSIGPACAAFWCAVQASVQAMEAAEQLARAVYRRQVCTLGLVKILALQCVGSNSSGC